VVEDQLIECAKIRDLNQFPIPLWSMPSSPAALIRGMAINVENNIPDDDAAVIRVRS
jgi:hypothetical protein